MRIVFWGSALFVAYVYVGYPALLMVWARLVRPRQASPHRLRRFPDISIILATRNEGARLEKRVRNLLSLRYPARRQIVVVSDGSTDDTAVVLAAFGRDVELIPIPASGKAAALNTGVAAARHDILVFADARQTFAPDALEALTAPFADQAIGGVTGELLLGCEQGGRRQGDDRRAPVAAVRRRERRTKGERRGHLASTIADGVGTYWRYEKMLRRLESRVGSTLGATGAIYALRRSLWQPLPAQTILDDVLAPMRAVLAGRRIVFEDRAQAFDETSLDSGAESRRKIRTLAGNFQILALEPRLLLPMVNPVWIQYLSHKVGRLLVPYALLALLASSIVLAGAHPFYAAALAGQCGFFLLAGYGAWLEYRRSVELPQPSGRLKDRNWEAAAAEAEPASATSRKRVASA